MPETGEKTRRRRRASSAASSSAKRTRSKAKDTGDEATGTAGDAADEAKGAAGDTADAAGDAAGGTTITSELIDAVRSAAIEVLKPVAKEATTTAAKFAVAKGPDLVKGKVGPAMAAAGGPAEMAKGALSKGGDLAGGLTDKLGGKDKGGKSPTGTGRGRRLPVQESVDVAVDLETAYDQWTQFEEFPKFMHRVEKIEQRDDTTLMWHENIWGVRRSWEAEILEQIPLERIVWKSKGGPQVVGVVTFHRLSDNLTRIEINMDFQPKGLFEKTASGFRMSRRALKSDLMRFKAFIEMKDDPTGEWHGRIEDGEVVEEEDPRFSKDDEGEEPEAESDEDFEDEDEEEEDEEPEEDEELEEEDEPEAESDEDFEDEEEDEEPEPAPKPKRRSPRKRSTSSSKSGASNGRTSGSRKKKTTAKASR